MPIASDPEGVGQSLRLRSAYPARTRQEIAAQLGVAKSTVDKALQRYGI